MISKPKSEKPGFLRESGVAPRKKPSLSSFMEVAPLLDKVAEAMGCGIAVTFAKEHLYCSPGFPELSSESAAQQLGIGFDECDAQLEIIVPDERKRNLALARYATMGLVSAGVVHDLRNIFAGIMVALPQLTKTPAVQEKQELSTVVGWLEEAVENCRQIIQRFESIAENKRQTTRENVHETVESAIRMCNSLLICKQISVENNVLNDLEAGMVRSDVQLAIINIIFNAVEHGIRKKGRISFDAASMDGHVLLRIENDGAPIPESIREKLLKEPLSKDCDLGYGMYTSVMNLRSFGGDIDFASSSERTAFILKLPGADTVEIPGVQL